MTGRWFGGDDQMLRDVAELTDLPLLKKDFITRESQIADAKEMGASAILLTARILPEVDASEADRDHPPPRTDAVRRGHRSGRARQRDPCRGLHRRGQQQGHPRAGARTSGDIDVSRALLEPALEAGTPCPVSASAIIDPKVAAELIDAGFKGLLVGTGLLLTDSVQGWVDDFERHRQRAGLRQAGDRERRSR